MTLLIHNTKRPTGGNVYFEYFHTATGKVPGPGFELRASITEDPLIRIYERIIIKDGRRIET